MPETKKKFCVTTPLYYVNYRPHIGHAYTTLAADVLARHMRARGTEVFFQTGTDEHGASVARTAAERGSGPKEWADEISADFERAWKLLNVNYDRFIRTTEPEHERRVQDAFERMRASGDVYPGSYSGLYCASCENFYEKKDLLQGGLCPVHKKIVEEVSEDTYFFRLSGYKKKLLDHYAANPGFIEPKHRAAEIVNFVRSGLRDISVSRTKVAWGIPVRSDPKHTVYVWFDALLNYITGAGWEAGGETAEFRSVWPADVHLVGKEILRFHAVTWPAMLMSLGLPLPRKIYAHGWWTIEGDKMSKSRGNVVSPADAIKEYGADALRYFLFREVPFGHDGNFSTESLRKRYNSELANDLGNLFSRVLNLAKKHLGNKLPHKPEEASALTFARLRALDADIAADIEELRFDRALDRIWGAVGELNRGIDARKPWALAKSDPAALAAFLKDMVWCLRLVAGWVYPFMPDTSARMQMLMSIGDTEAEGVEPQKIPPLFPRKP